MGQPAVVAGDKVQGQCAGHQVPGPVGSPIPSPPLPFGAPLTMGLATTVLVGGKPMAVEGSKGYNVPPHVGLHATDPKLVPLTQEAAIVRGSTTVIVEGKGAAHSSCLATACLAPAPVVQGSATTVLVGP